jgi:putative transposase
MPRPPRVEVPGGFFHVTSGAVAEQAFFHHVNDWPFFLTLLARTIARYGWRCLSYCLMTTHYHLLIQTPEPTLSRGMQLLNGSYAQAFNDWHGRRGHVVRSRFTAIHVEQESHLLEAARYVVLNPVRAGMCKKPANWLWSSFRATVGLAVRPPFLDVDELLGVFDPNPVEARDQYARFVLDGLASS